MKTPTVSELLALKWENVNKDLRILQLELQQVQQAGQQIQQWAQQASQVRGALEADMRIEVGADPKAMYDSSTRTFRPSTPQKAK